MRASFAALVTYLSIACSWDTNANDLQHNFFFQHFNFSDEAFDRGLRARPGASIPDAMKAVFGGHRFTRVRGDIHHPLHALHRIRPSQGHSMVDIYAAVHEGGHRFCGLIRDNWACRGERYIKVLKGTPRFNFTRGGLGILKKDHPGSLFIFAEGSSYLAEAITTLVCEHDMEAWTLDANESNSILAQLPDENITVLLLSNHYIFNGNTGLTINLLKHIGFRVDAAILGSFNIGFCQMKPNSLAARKREFEEAFPGAAVRAYNSEKVLPISCRAEFTDCAHDGGKSTHQCVPGPILRTAEKLVEALGRDKRRIGSLDLASDIERHEHGLSLPGGQRQQKSRATSRQRRKEMRAREALVNRNGPHITRSKNARAGT